MNLKLISAGIIAAFSIGAAHADSFTNGGFEGGTIAGWTQGGGSWFSSSIPLPATNTFFPGSGPVLVTSAGTDAITGISTVRYGDHSVRVNDSINNYSVSALRQSVTNYSGTSINFSWAAVLESSHGSLDSDQFRITLTDDTTGTTLANIAYNSFDNGALFTQYGAWFGTQWIDETIAVTQGHNFTLTLLAADCPYGGHAGYVYLDGFGTVTGGPGDGDPPTPSVPEPATLALVGTALLGLAARRRRKA